MSTSGTSGTLFSGNSRFATDFKSTIDRAVAIASMPLTQMQQSLQSMDDESSALTSLKTKFTALDTAISGLQSATTSGTYATTISDGSVISASTSGTPLPGTYSVKITSIGGYSSANSVPGTTIADPTQTSLSNAASFTLSTGSGTFTITPASNTLNALADAINAETSANVQATIFNSGTSDAPNYRLSLQSTKLGAVSFGLSDPSHPLLGTPADTEVTSADGLATVTDPASQNISSRTGFVLTVQGQTSPFMLTGVTSLNSLAQKINDLSISGVTAAVVDASGGAGTDYRLQITKPSGATVSLSENLMDSGTQGSLATYSVNGSDPISSDTRTVTITTGMTATLLKAQAVGDSAATITVSRTTSGISSALTAFVSAYNAAATEIANHHSAAKSALDGNSILSLASAMLRNLVTHSNTGGYFSGMVAGKISADDRHNIGLSIGNDGLLTFDSTAFANNTNGRMDDVLGLLGDTEAGGFLKVATDSLSTLLDADSGALATAIDSVHDEIQTQNDRIAAKRDQIDELEMTLNARMAAADAAVAMLEQQVGYLTGMFDAMRQASEN